MILWEVPLRLLYQAEHVFMFMNGVKLRRPYAATGGDMSDMEKLLKL